MRSASAHRIRISDVLLGCVSFDMICRIDDNWRSHCSWGFRLRSPAWQPTAALQKRNDRLVSSAADATSVSRTNTNNTYFRLRAWCQFSFLQDGKGRINYTRWSIKNLLWIRYILHFFNRIFRTTQLIKLLLCTSYPSFQDSRELFIS